LATGSAKLIVRVSGGNVPPAPPLPRQLAVQVIVTLAVYALPGSPLLGQV